MAYESEADIIGYGGAAGGGKTDLLFGLAHLRHHRSIIFRREFTQLEGLEERAADIFVGRGRYNSQKHRWRLDDGKMVEFGAVQDVDDVNKYQGRAHDLKGFDELTHFTEYQFRFLQTWARTTRRGQRCRIVATFNPPTTAEGDWVIGYFGPWLDRNHPDPAKPGELRFFATIAGKDTPRPDGRPFIYADEHGNEEVIVAKSRTFIPAKVEDNPYLMSTGYRATLQALPEPLRSQMLRGDFAAGQADHAWQAIPTAWIVAAQGRWKDRTREERGALSALGVDVARGGNDQTVYTPRYSHHFGKQVVKPGRLTPDGQAVIRDALVLLNGETHPTVQIDVIGIGSSPVDVGKMYSLKVVPMNASNASFATDRSKKLRFVNKRAEWVWKLREALDPASGEDIEIPPDAELRADLASFRWKLMARGIQIESKDDIKERIHRSPDKGESLILAHADPGGHVPIAGPIVVSAGPRMMPG